MDPPQPDHGATALASICDVPRETLDALQAYVAILVRWNPRINLVAPSTISSLWKRHVADSAQLWQLRPPQTRRWVDLGSGGGFPGLVIAVLGRSSGLKVDLVESDRRKAVFLSSVIRELELPAKVTMERIEVAELEPADVVSARALAPLSDLIGHVPRFRHADGLALFPKGRQANNELDLARRRWNFEWKRHESLTDPDATIFEIGMIHGPR